MMIADLLSWKPLEAGTAATPLSLTADEGTWIKLVDFKTHLNVVLIFFRRMDDNATEAFLKAVQAQHARFEELECGIFGVHTARTDKLREFRSRLGINFFLLYDPMAFAARGFRASSRVRPICKDTVVVIGKDGNVLHSQRGFPDVEELLSVLARAEGKAVPPPVATVQAAGSTIRDPGKGSAAVRDIESAEAIRMLEEKDTPFILVDVRTKAEWEREHSPLARLIPVDELPHRYAELKQTTHVIFVCQAGGRSAAAAEFMTSIGASDVFNVLGGMSEWSGSKVSGS
jgi:rhodanese-related sulfurtransferase/peroxiredoxin